MMKILIVDDNLRRYSRLVESIVQCGVERERVELVSCANDARERIEESYYDLLVLDVLIPLRPENEPSVLNSLELLLEISAGDSLQKPGRIVGVTSDKTAMHEAAGKFGEWTWTIVELSDINDEWIARITNCVRYIVDERDKANIRRPEHQVDLAIICSLEAPELEEILKLPWGWSVARPIDDVTFVNEGRFESDGRTFTVCATFASRMGMVSAALKSAAVISLFRPRLIAMCGICAGVKGKVNLGDVLFSDPVWDFQSGKRVRDRENSKFSISPHQLHSPAIVRTHVEQLRSEVPELARIYTAFGSDAPGAFRIVVGPVASGSAVLADGEVIEDIKKQHREVLGVEMEAYGVYAAAYGASHPQPLPFALKAVSDFADPDKADANQRYAAYTSANVLRLLMEKFGARLMG